MSQLFNQKKTGSILSFGELLIRLCPDAGGNWLEKGQLPFYIGGAELNVAHALGLWGLPVKYFTVLPDNGVSAQIINYVKSRGVDTSAVQFGGDRIGLYFLTEGQDIKHDALVYDRAGSAFAQIKTNTINWDKVLRGISWFHFSAICPAIGQNVADVCAEALEAASAKGIGISVDLNYRSRLWQYGKSPVEVMPGLVKYCDLVMGNVWSAENMLGIKVRQDIHQRQSKEVYLEQSAQTSKEVINRFPKCSVVAHTFRFDATTDIKYYTTLYTGSHLHTSREYRAGTIADKVGTGDCFMAGLIYGIYNGLNPQEGLAFATAAAFEKLFIKGDAITKTAEQINQTLI